MRASSKPAHPTVIPIERETMMGPIRDPRHVARLLDVRVLQHTENSCSVACMAMLVNAIRALDATYASHQPVSQPELLHRVACPEWKSAVAPGGDGVTLDELADLAERSLKAFGIARSQVDVVHVDRVTPAVRNRMRQTLNEIDHAASLFVVANFLQAVYTGDEHSTSGHFALVAGYDPALSSVLMLDPDRRDYQPYWVSEQSFLDGMATLDESSGRSRGYLTIRVEPARRA